MEVYRLALFADDIGWQDVLVISKEKLMWSVADQLHRSLGSARESRDWYYKSRHVLPAEVFKHRLGLTTHIIGMLTPMIPHQRSHAIREDQAKYNTTPQPSAFNLDSEIPVP